jgi:tetratricopeptide (TPR) repeat protein
MSSATEILPERYRDPERIASGAMGDVYRAIDSALGRTVAVKVLAEPFAGDEPARQRFAREARAAARVSGDPNIVTIYDVGESGDRPFIVMEYVDGSSLEQRLAEDGPPTPVDLLPVLEGAARALDHAHANGVVHRDVKPGNLLLDAAGNVRVADFGIASAAWLPSLTAAGTVLGTAGYLAPEQAMGKPASPASDRYALAVVAYELLTGTRPFARESPTAEAAAHVHEPVPPVGGRKDLPVELDAVFERALAKRPEDRYASCTEFVAALRAALAGTTGTRVYAASPATVLTRVRRPAQRWTLLAAAAGAAVVAAVVLAVALSGTSSSSPTGAQAHSRVRRTTDPHALNNRAWSLMQQGRYDAALPLLERAVRALRGAGPGDPVEGFANYNLGYTLFKLGRCSEALLPLQRAQTLEPQRREVASAQAAVRQCLAPAPAPKKKHEHHGKHRKGNH